MANGVNKSAGAKIYIGTTSGNTQSDTFTEIGEVENIGDFGRQYQEITRSSLGNRNVEKLKGQRDDGNIVLELGRDLTDAGQLALKTALDSDYDYNFKIELDDESATSGSHPSYFWFRAKVMSFVDKIGGAKDYLRAQVTLGIKTGSFQTIIAN